MYPHLFDKEAVNCKHALAIIAKCIVTLPFKYRHQHQTCAHLHLNAYRRYDFSQNPDLRHQADCPLLVWAEIIDSRPLTSPPLWCHVLSSYEPVSFCWLMSAVKELVPEHSSGGRVMWAGERYRWFDCHPPGRWTDNSKCTKRTYAQTCTQTHTRTHSQPSSPLHTDLSVSIKSLLYHCFYSLMILYAMAKGCSKGCGSP